MSAVHTDERLASCLCTQAQLSSPRFQQWAARLGEPAAMNRKTWEWCYIAAALEERGMLGPGRRGLGFAVGKEPLPALFASMGCEILATDLHGHHGKAAGWIDSDQHADRLEDLNERQLCPPEAFVARVRFEYADMSRIPSHLRGFDFLWSACSLEHLGSISQGEQFIYDSLACLRPGGHAVHTTEYNASSNTRTIDYRGTVLFRRCDIERIVRNLTECGHRVAPVDWSTGDLPLDNVIDVPPYRKDPHLKLLFKQHVVTSFGIAIQKLTDRVPRAPRFATRPTIGAVLRFALRASRPRRASR